MSKYPCELIEDLIPLYIEDDVSDATKKIVEEHIKECENCKSLVHEYSNDELKIEDFKEDLPEAKTFKKWMKKLKVWGVVTGIVALIALITIGVLGYKIGEDAENGVLTLKTIVKTLEKEGLSIEKDKSKSPDEYDLSGVKPSIYTVEDSKDTLLIYVFDSFREKEKILDETDRFNNNYSMEEFSYNAKNSLIVFIPNETPGNEEEFKALGDKLNLISETTFKYLNNGKERVYKGESENWQGTFTMKYYEQWFKDEVGIQYDSYSTDYPVIKYKGEDLDNVGTIDIEYETANGGGHSTGLNLDKDGYAKAGSFGGNGSILAEDNDITFIIKWNGKEERIVLKAQIDE